MAAAAARRIVSVDVECVATGYGHSDREMCRVAVVDGSEKVLYSAFVQPTKPVVSYLTPITGIRDGDLASAVTRDEALKAVHALLDPNVLLVGQAPHHDVEWLALVQGVHFDALHDLSETFKAFNRQYNNTSFFSLEHEATVLLPDMVMHGGGSHDPAVDAIASVRLYNTFVAAPDAARKLEAARAKLLSVRPAPSVAKRLNYNCEGVCMAAFYSAMCKCGQPTKAGKAKAVLSVAPVTRGPKS